MRPLFDSSRTAAPMNTHIINIKPRLPQVEAKARQLYDYEQEPAEAVKLTPVEVKALCAILRRLPATDPYYTQARELVNRMENPK